VLEFGYLFVRIFRIMFQFNQVLYGNCEAAFRASLFSLIRCAMPQKCLS
jgi:hypothetical protein